MTENEPEIFDGHIHLQPGVCNPPQEFVKKAHAAGVGGGIIFSLAPYRYRPLPEAKNWEARLDFILEYTAQTPGFYPFFWIDPTAPDAPAQIARAAEKGICGFKVICSDFFPEEGMKSYQLIAETGKPLTFHCGGLWSDNVSNKYNRPTNFEILAEVPGLKVALAHFGWPWCDELIALYGKFFYLTRCGKCSAKLFLDTTPGTPAPYRKDAMQKLFFCCADAGNRCFFGSDASINRYGAKTLALLKSLDRPILDHLAEDFQKAEFPHEMSVFHYEDQTGLYDRVFRKNYQNFIFNKEEK